MILHSLTVHSVPALWACNGKASSNALPVLCSRNTQSANLSLFWDNSTQAQSSFEFYVTCRSWSIASSQNVHVKRKNKYGCHCHENHGLIATKKCLPRRNLGLWHCSKPYQYLKANIHFMPVPFFFISSLKSFLGFPHFMYFSQTPRLTLWAASVKIHAMFSLS